MPLSSMSRTGEVVMNLSHRVSNLETRAGVGREAEEARQRDSEGSRERFLADLETVGSHMTPATRAAIANDSQAMDSLVRFLEYLKSGGIRSGPIPTPEGRWSNRELLAWWYIGGQHEPGKQSREVGEA